MQKHQTLAVLALGAALGFVAAQERLPWQSRVAANTARVEFDRETAQSVKEATAPCAHAQSQCAQGQLSCCADASRGEQLLALADASAAVAAHNLAVAATAQASGKKPNIVVIWGDDIGYWNVSMNNQGMMGYKTPNIDRIAKEGANFTDWYGQQSCTAGRASFITGQVGFRTGLLNERRGRAFKFQNWLGERPVNGKRIDQPILKFERPTPEQRRNSLSKRLLARDACRS